MGKGKRTRTAKLRVIKGGAEDANKKPHPLAGKPREEIAQEEAALEHGIPLKRGRAIER